MFPLNILSKNAVEHKSSSRFWTWGNIHCDKEIFPPPHTHTDT